MTKVLTLGLGFTLLFVPLGVIFGDQTPTEALLSKINRLSPAERQQALETGARKEGVVVLYGTPPVEEMTLRTAAFKARYPYLTVRHAQKGGKEAREQAILEYNAGKVQSDMTITGIVYKHRETWASYTSPHKRAIHAPLLATEDRGMSLYFGPIIMAYNTKMVGKGPAPRNYEDLLDPRWKGLIGIDTAPVQLIAALVSHWGVEKTRDYFEKLLANKPLVRRGRAIHLQSICAGETAIAVNVSTYAVAEIKEKGCPLEIIVPDPVAISAIHVSILNRAPRPHAAALFHDFLFSKEGQEINIKVHRIPARSDMPYSGLWSKELAPEAVLTKYRFSVYEGSENEDKHEPAVFRIIKEVFLRGGK